MRRGRVWGVGMCTVWAGGRVGGEASLGFGGADRRRLVGEWGVAGGGMGDGLGGRKGGAVSHDRADDGRFGCEGDFVFCALPKRANTHPI